MPKDHKRHLISNMKGEFIEIEKEVYKTKVKPIDFEVFKSMVRDRDRLWFREGKYQEFLKNRHK